MTLWLKLYQMRRPKNLLTHCKIKTEALVDTLADTLAKAEGEKLRFRFTNVEADIMIY